MSTQNSDSNLVVFGGFQINISDVNFNDHSSNVAAIQVSSIIFSFFVVLTVALRIFSRIKYVHNIFADDVLIMFAAAFTVALGVTCIVGTFYGGLGQHVWLLPMTNILDTIRSCVLDLFICQVLYAFAIALTKLAIIASYLRFIQDRSFHVAMYVTLFPIVGLWVTGVFVTLFQCRPFEGAWNFMLTNRRCIDYVNYLYASSVVNVITDIALCVLPLPYFWKLSMTRKQRAILCVLLAGGASACLVGLIRIAFLHQLRGFDISYRSVPSLILSLAECSMGIISVSIPALRPMARKVFPAALRSEGLSSSRPRTTRIRLSSLSPSHDRTAVKSEEKKRFSEPCEPWRS